MSFWNRSRGRGVIASLSAAADKVQERSGNAGEYQLLYKYLRDRFANRLVLTFAEIEDILGSGLPVSARRYPAWWSNNEGSHVQAEAWLTAGFRTEQVDIPGEKLTFVRSEMTHAFGGFSDSASGEFPVVGGSENSQSTKQAPKRPALFGSLKGTTIIMPGVDLTAPTAPEWGRLDDD